MTSKLYRKGYRFEKEVQKWLEKEGWFVVRQGKSKFPDLIAIRKLMSGNGFRVVFIECKYNKKPSREEIMKAKELEEKYGIQFEFCIKKKGDRDFNFYGPEELDGEDEE